jgi:hypothetical protein
MRALVALTFLTLVPIAHAADPRFAASPTAAVRPLARETAALLGDALRRSALVRWQVGVLEGSDLIVYVSERFESESGEPKGRLQFLTAAAGKRYVVVSLDRWKLSWDERLVLLAHELQHAVEIAQDPTVHDLAGFRSLYLRIGWELKAGRFETEAACQATARMRLELQAERARPAAHE